MIFLFGLSHFLRFYLRFFGLIPIIKFFIVIVKNSVVESSKLYYRIFMCINRIKTAGGIKSELKYLVQNTSDHRGAEFRGKFYSFAAEARAAFDERTPLIDFERPPELLRRVRLKHQRFFRRIRAVSESLRAVAA